MDSHKKPQYQFLPKRMKEVVDHVGPRQMYELLRYVSMTLRHMCSRV